LGLHSPRLTVSPRVWGFFIFFKNVYEEFFSGLGRLDRRLTKAGFGRLVGSLTVFALQIRTVGWSYYFCETRLFFGKSWYTVEYYTVTVLRWNDWQGCLPCLPAYSQINSLNHVKFSWLTNHVVPVSCPRIWVWLPRPQAVSADVMSPRSPSHTKHGCSMPLPRL